MDKKMNSEKMSQQTTRQSKDGDSILQIDSLSVEFELEDRKIRALRDVSLDIKRGEILGIAGESGSGKSTLALATLRYLDANGTITEGDIKFDGESLLDKSEGELRALSGSQIAHVAQNPATALNPSMRIGKQIRETIQVHQDISEDDRLNELVQESLTQVNIPDPENAAKSYPHELSGGMQQRALVAMALACNPDLLILDEPTTGLDVTTQAKILDLIDGLIKEQDIGIMLITHNLGVIAQTADRINILYAGEIMERGPVDEVFKNPANPYTQGLLATTPTIEEEKHLKPISGQIPTVTESPSGCIFANRCEFSESACRSSSIEMETVGSSHETRCRRWETVIQQPIQSDIREQEHREQGEQLIKIKDLEKYYGKSSITDRFFGADDPVKAVNGVSLEIHEGEAVGLVGESGCGKSTLGRSLLRLEDLTGGTITYGGDEISSFSKSEMQEFRSECQILFQNPESSLNPKKSIYKLLERPLKIFTDKDKQQRENRIAELLSQVNLTTDLASKYPHELSGGQQQRAAIAQVFAAEPSFVVLDEPVSSLDVSVQASILNLLEELREEYNTSYLLISHDLSVVKSLCDRISVMYLGELVETGTVDDVFNPPFHPYTRSLLSSIPAIDPQREFKNIELDGDVPSPRDPPSGCSFHTRCPQKIGEICEREDPALETAPQSARNHCISCHLDDEEMNYQLDSDI